MNIKKHLFLASLVGFALQSPATSLAAESDSASTDSRSAAVAKKMPEADLKIAMPADAVLQIMGKPESIKEMKAPSGKAEIWTYERQVGDIVEHVQFLTPTSTTLMESGGKTDTIASGDQIEYRDEHHITTDVVEVLMYNDHFLKCKVSRQESVKVFQ
jgi:hypothetical protein